MKRLLTAIFAFALIGLIFSSCKKDETTTSSNSVTIQSEFTIGEQTFTNPTFDLGKPADLEGYLVNYSKPPIYNTIRINNEEIDLGNNIALDFDLEIYSAEPGADLEAYMDLQVYDNTPVKSTGIYIYSQSITATVTKVGEVGGYIEGTYEGDFYYDKKGVPPSFRVTGKFKVMRNATPVK